MQKTEPGTRALIREHLRKLTTKELYGTLAFEEEISKRILPGNAILIDGKIITAHKGEIVEGQTSYWISIHNRIGLDDEDDKKPMVYGPLDDIEVEFEDLKQLPRKEEKENKIIKEKKIKRTKPML